MVSPRYIPDHKRLAAELKKQIRNTRDAQRPTGTEVNGVLGELQKSVAELEARSSHQTAPNNLTLLYGTGYGQRGPATQTFTLAGPQGGRRTAILTGSGTFEWAGPAGSPTNASSVTLRLELWQASKLLWSDVSVVDSFPFIPASFSGDSFSVVSSVLVPADTEPVFELRLYGYRSADGGNATDAGRAADMSFTLQYGDRY